MNFQIYFKDIQKEIYYLKGIDVSETSKDSNFFMKLKIQVELQMQNIRDDIAVFLGDESVQNITNPRSSDIQKQKILDKLVKFRKENQQVLEQIKSITSSQDVIVCPLCSSWMRKIPVGVNYERIGDSIVIKDDNIKGQITYIYGCDKCPLAIDEEIYISDQVKLYN